MLLGRLGRAVGLQGSLAEAVNILNECRESWNDVCMRVMAGAVAGNIPAVHRMLEQEYEGSQVRRWKHMDAEFGRRMIDDPRTATDHRDEVIPEAYRLLVID